MNYSSKILEISGYRSGPVPNTFIRHHGKADHLAILFPGINYTCKMPLLYYQTRLFLSLGADVLCVEYAYNQRADFQSLFDSEQGSWFLTDVTAACRAGLQQDEYSKVTLTGKSLGTLALGHLLASEPLLSNIQVVWLTPLLKDENLRAQIRRATQQSIMVIGTNDVHYDTAYLEELKVLSQVRAVILEGADHSLEVKGNLLNSIKLMGQLMSEIAQFVAPGIKDEKAQDE